MKPKILIIEDNEQNMYMLSYLLESNNYEVIKSKNGKEGIILAEKFMPDAIILDIQLPEMDGYEVARELRKIKVLKNVLIIVVTSYAMVGDKEKALASGANGYIEKPIDPDSFISQLKGYLLEKRRSDDN
ncbi:MAG: response regulator [Candidatus Cloacimonetes bacterium]|jgi:two-component system cell cycle response regulator DivK|nr:response regulator [Candidatus Cloacimonadota bacterium]